MKEKGDRVVECRGKERGERKKEGQLLTALARAVCVGGYRAAASMTTDERKHKKRVGIVWRSMAELAASTNPVHETEAAVSQQERLIG